MERRIEALQKLLLLDTRLLENCLDGVDDELARRRLTSNTNHIGFVVCHVVDSRYFLARMLGSDAECQFKQQLEGVRSVEDMREIPALADLRHAWAGVSAILSERFSEITEGELCEPYAHQFPVDRTLLGGVAFLLQHEAFHLGQLAFLRKALGLGPMRYD